MKKMMLVFAIVFTVFGCSPSDVTPTAAEVDKQSGFWYLEQKEYTDYEFPQYNSNKILKGDEKPCALNYIYIYGDYYSRTTDNSFTSDLLKIYKDATLTTSIKDCNNVTQNFINSKEFSIKEGFVIKKSQRIYLGANSVFDEADSILWTMESNKLVKTGYRVKNRNNEKKTTISSKSVTKYKKQ